MAAFVSDTFTDVNLTPLDAHVGEQATWVRNPASTSGATRWVIDSANRAFSSGGVEVMTATPAPPTSEYDVTADHVVLSLTGSQGHGGRWDTATLTGYAVRITSGAALQLMKVVNNANTVLAGSTYVLTSPVGQTYSVTLQIRDAAKTVLVNGVVAYSTPDNSIAAAGRVGVWCNSGASGTTGVHLDNLVASTPVLSADDAWSISDAASASASISRAVSETITISDAVIRVRAGGRTATESWATSDTAKAVRHYGRVIADSWAVSDTLGAVVKFSLDFPLTLTIAEPSQASLTIADAVSTALTVTEVEATSLRVDEPVLAVLDVDVPPTASLRIEGH